MFSNLILPDAIPDQSRALAILSPLTGKVVPLDQYPGEIFRQRLLGEGVAIELTGSKVLAPFNGTMNYAPATGHQIRIQANNGLMMLIQIGVGAEALLGEGFVCHIKPGQTFNRGDLLLSFNIQKLRNRLKELISAVTILNSNKLAGILPHYQQVIAGQDNFMTLYTHRI